MKLLTFVEDRIREIEQKYAYLLQDFLILRLSEETFRLILLFNDGTTLRVAERWRDNKLIRYSYYWLDTKNNLKIGWDNAPHHTHLKNFPHHKHVESRINLQSSLETCLEEVMIVIINQS